MKKVKTCEFCNAQYKRYKTRTRTLCEAESPNIRLGHEAYRDGFVMNNQKDETMAAVQGHTDMAMAMLNAGEDIGMTVELARDIYVSLYGGDAGFEQYVAENYDSSADYWRVHADGTVTWDGHLNLYKDGETDINDAKAGFIKGYEDLDKIIADAEKDGQTSVVLDDGTEVSLSRLKEIYHANNYIIAKATDIHGKPKTSVDAALLDDGFMSFEEADNAKTKLIDRYINYGIRPNLVEHWSVRYVLNDNNDFAKTDWANSDYVPNNQSVKDFRKYVKNGDITFPDNIELLGDGASVYHGDGCLKYLSNNDDFIGSSRELVLRYDSENMSYSMETRDAYLGTYNFGDGPLKIHHTNLDVLPYWKWANTPDDLFGSNAQGINATPFFKRMHPNIQKNIDIQNERLLENHKYAPFLYLQSVNRMN